MNGKLIVVLPILGLSGAQNAIAEHTAGTGAQLPGYYATEPPLYENSYPALPVVKKDSSDDSQGPVGDESQGGGDC